MKDYLALLRGINVGGNSIIKMSELKTCFEKSGFSEVVTYIQSGNVLFKFAEKEKDQLTIRVEKSLSEMLGYNLMVLLIEYLQLKNIVEKAPKGFGSRPDKYRYDVIFLKEPLTAKEVFAKIRVKDGVDKAYAGESVLYFSRLIEKASQSYLTKLISMPIYKSLTIRNWNTTTKLFAMMEKRVPAII